MKVYSEIEELRDAPGAIHLAIGVFDGVHLGHQKVIRRAQQGADQDGGTAVVVTFDPHPAEILRPGGGPLLITPGRQQHAVMAEFGVRAILEVRFDEAFAEIEAEDFVVALVRACAGRLKRVCVGYDWRFGRGRAGDVALLSELGRREGFEVTAIPAVEVGGAVVRSTRVREAVCGAELGVVRQLLGRDYGISGKVVRGAGLGRKIGFPTANLDVENRLMPPYGVYAVRVSDGERRGIGVANFGVRPTIGGDSGEAVFEVHLFDWAEDLYGRVVGVDLVSRLRGEQNFGSLEELREQIGKDVEEAKAILGE